MVQTEASTREFKRIGGELCLDFVNTVDWHASDSPQELVADYQQLVEWSRQSRIMDDAEAERLLQEADAHPAAAKRAYQRAVVIREALYSLLVATIENHSPPSSDLREFNAALAEALGRMRLVHAKGGYTWVWGQDGPELESLLWPILRSAAELLTSDRRARLGQCSDDRGCGWLFLDMSKNRSRRWCDMADCGNRAKVRSHYLRKRAQNV